MSQETLEVVRRLYELWNRGDVDSATEMLEPGVVWHGYSHLPDPGVRHGADQARRWATEFAEAWGEIRVEVDRLVEVGDDDVLALVRMSGRGLGSGAEVISGLDGHVWTIRGGKVAAVRMYQGADAALEAVGLRE